MNCKGCWKCPVRYYCAECEESLCEECDLKIHRGGTRRHHERRSLCKCGLPGENFCIDCNGEVCFDCHHMHSGHILEPLVFPIKLGIFWDFFSSPAGSGVEVEAAVTQLQEVSPQISVFKVYGAVPAHCQSVLESCGSIIESDREKDMYGLLLDISLGSVCGLTHVVVLSSYALQMKPYLIHIQSSLSLKVLVSTTSVPLNLMSIDLLPHQSLSFQHKTLHCDKKILLEACQVNQSFPPIRETQHEQLLQLLKVEAAAGNILHRAETLSALAGGEEVLNSAQNAGLVFISEKTFGRLSTVRFVGVKIDGLSLESLLWTLRSLKKDEMLPTERAIQSRMKEAFDFRPSTVQWKNLLEAVRRFSVLGERPIGVPEFVVREFVDPVTQQESSLLYPRDEEWLSLDQQPPNALKASTAWGAFTQFLDGYFTGPDGIDEARALPGGRYGCAQFLKFCGSAPLQTLSLGRLSFMVQLAISENLFRYKKTLLVWSPRVHHYGERGDLLVRQRTAREKVLEVLKENDGGMSLALLPMNLKKKLDRLDLNELGFTKLKDLLSTIPEVEVVLKGTNHPFAVLKTERPLSANALASAMQDTVREHGGEISAFKLEEILTAQIGRPLLWSDFQCHSVLEFVSKHACDLEIRGFATVAIRTDISTDHSKSSSVDDIAKPRTEDEGIDFERFFQRLLSDEPIFHVNTA